MYSTLSLAVYVGALEILNSLNFNATLKKFSVFISFGLSFVDHFVAELGVGSGQTDRQQCIMRLCTGRAA